MTPPPTDEKALPPFATGVSLRQGRAEASLFYMLVGDTKPERNATESDLSAQLEALDPEVRERLLSTFESARVDDYERKAQAATERAMKAESELSAASSEVERLRAETQDQRCWALNVAWQSGWAATPEEATAEAAFEFLDALLHPSPKEPTP